MAEQTRDGYGNGTYINRGLPPRSALLAFTAALVGATVGFVAVLAVVQPAMSRDLAAQTKVLNQRLADAVAQSDTAAACTQTGGAGAGQVLGEMTPAEQLMHVPGAGGQQPGQGGSGSQTFVKKLVAGSFAKSAATISNTGPHSTNEISVRNNANTSVSTSTKIDVSSTTNQTSSSGESKVADTTYGGSAATGDAVNNATTSFNITANN